MRNTQSDWRYTLFTILSLAIIFSAILFFRNDIKITGFLIYNFSHGESNISINFSSETAQINPYFYGVNTHGTWASGNSLIDINEDGAVDTQSNYEWHRQKLSEANLNYLRADMGLAWKSNGYKTYYSYFNISAEQDIIEWAHNNSIKVMYIASYMPYWLANRSDLCSQSTINTTAVSQCTPLNYTQWGDIVVDYIDQVTQNGKYNSTIDIEVWNEPDLSFWLPNLSYTNPKKII
jgi:hypothetical protein